MAGALSAPEDLLDEDRSPPVSVGLHRVRVPLRTPHRSAHGTEVDRESVLVRWEHPGGAVGWGECPALSGAGYVTEPVGLAWSALRDELAPAALTGSPVRSGVADAHPASLAALADARLDALLRARGRSLASDWSAAASVPSTTVLALVGVDEERLVERVAEAAARSALIKVKVVAGSAARVARRVLGAAGGTPVAVDANGSFRADDPVDRADLEELLGLSLSYVEQPFAPGSPWAAWVDLASSGSPPLAIDESATSVASIVRAVESGAASVVSVKPARLGGVLAAAAAARAAAGAGARVFVGGMFELGVGRSSALVLAGSDVVDLPTDLGPSDRYVQEDVTDAIVAAGPGRVRVPHGPGVSMHPHPDRLARRTVDRHVLYRDAPAS